MSRKMFIALIPVALVLNLVGIYLLTTNNVSAPSPWTSLPENMDRPAPIETSATITMVGDIMLAREVERKLMVEGADWPFRFVKDLWAESDLIVGNFEATVRDAYRYEGEVLAFDVTPDLMTGLQDAGFTHLSLANNHGDDFGNAVTEYTREVFASLGITPFGDPVVSQNFVARANANGIPLSLIGFHAFIESPYDIATAIENEAAQGRFVIVMPHWGNEYQTYPSPAQIDAANNFIDAGADLIVGTHAHVVQPIESVRGIPVAWSLGNFVFDQDWSQATQEGLLLTIKLTDDAISISPTPVSVTNRQALVMTGDRAQEILNFVGAPTGTMTFTRP